MLLIVWVIWLTIFVFWLIRKKPYSTFRSKKVQTLDDIIKYPMQILKDPQGTNALMYYSQMWKNNKLYNVEVLYDKGANTIMHFKYTQKAIGPLQAIPK